MGSSPDQGVHFNKEDARAPFTVNKIRQRTVSTLASLALVLVMGCCGCKKAEPSTPEAETTRSPLRSENASPSEGQPIRERAKREKITPPPRERSVWEAKSAPRVSPPLRPTQPATVPTGSGSTAVANAVLASLLHLDLRHGLSREQAQEINYALQRLGEQGAAAVPSIRDFLQRNEDIVFDEIPGGGLVDFGSLRIGLLDALQQIGGAEAVQVEVETLQASADPLEIALLARNLEQHANGEYRQLELDAARASLALASSGDWKGGDVSPIFELLQALGNENVVTALKEAATQWNYYATLALAGLPDGVGIPALIELASDPNISAMGLGDFALRPLAQVALQNADAAQALFELARSNQIPATAWPTIVSSLAGTYIQYGYGIFGTTSSPQAGSNQEINQRIALIDRLLAVSSDPAAKQALLSARDGLLRRLPK